MTLKPQAPVYDKDVTEAAERLAADMLYSLVCDVLHYEPPEHDIVADAIRKLAEELRQRSRYPKD